MSQWKEDVVNAWKRACKTRENAYAPYSKFLVGAAVKFKGVEGFFSGCNVENASFGATVCAERNAIFNAISIKGVEEIEFMVLVTKTNPAQSPCGMCRQVIAEFATPETKIYFCNTEEIQKEIPFSELLTFPFSKGALE